MESPLDAVIHAFKYGGRNDLAGPLGRLMARQVEVPHRGLVVPVPLHRARRRERGYNQAELLARAACREWGIPWLEGLLCRSRVTRPQARLPEERRQENVRGAFEVPEPKWVRDRVIVLIDDVSSARGGQH